MEKAYDYPVDIEFTTNFLPDGSYRINLVQCRPFRVKGGGHVVPRPEGVDDRDVLLKTQGAVIGPSMVTTVGRLTLSDRYSVARLIGRLACLETRPEGALLLAGPGRWGTAEPALGVPVAFAEISRVTALCEVIEMREGLVPDVSLGTHFFNDLVEIRILYLAPVPGKEGNLVNADFIAEALNRLPDLIPEEAVWAKVVRVIDPAGLRLHADALRQTAICYFEPKTAL